LLAVESATATLNLITSVPEINVRSLADYGVVGIRLLAVVFLHLKLPVWVLPTFVVTGYLNIQELLKRVSSINLLM
jgi:hypothetical protein